MLGAHRGEPIMSACFEALAVTRDQGVSGYALDLLMWVSIPERR
jgi:hypothetical protein